MARDTLILDLNDPAQRMATINAIVTAPAGFYEFSFHRRHRGRTLPQNAYLWGVVYPRFAAGWREAQGEDWFDADAAHEWCKKEFNGRDLMNPRTGEIERVGGSTTALDTVQMSVYIDRIIMFAAEWLRTEIPPATYAGEAIKDEGAWK